MEDYVDLDRRFTPYRDDADAEQAAQASYLASFRGRSGSATWDELLDRPRVVILGEAGSGKTYELKARCHALEQDGRHSFFLDLRRLVSESAFTILGGDDYRRFLAWKRGRDTGYFFLDAVDEAKLQVPKDFYRALDRFAKELGLAALNRAHVSLSSRISEWHPYTDRRDVRRLLPIPTPSPTQPASTRETESTLLGPDPLVIVQLEPLSPERVERFASQCGVTDVSRFMDAVDEHNAWAFTRRPVDVRGLANFWREKGQLGSLRELIEHELEQNLRERTERPDTLTPQQARSGAEWLGAACVLCREINIRVPDDRIVASSAGLDAAACLPADWQPESVRALLQRGIFDGAAYGRIRFHHRRLTEYLAARWIGLRMRDGRDFPSLRDLLFTEINRQWVLRPGLAPITAWLLLGEEPWRIGLRDLVLRSAPELPLQHGDPTALPLDYKKSALRHLARRYHDRGRVWLQVDVEALRRIAEPGLADTVSDLLRDRTLSGDLRSDMLLLVQHGHLESCMDAALEIVADPACSPGLKSYAAAAVRDAGHQSHKEQLAHILAGMDPVPSMLCAHACEATFPGVLGASALVDLLRRVSAVPESAIDLPYYLREHLKSLKGRYDPISVVARLTALGRTEPWIAFEGEPKPVSERFCWVGDPVLQALVDLLSSPKVDEEGATVAANALELLKFIQRHPGSYLRLPDDFRELVAQHPEVRRRHVWMRVAEYRAGRKAGDPRLFDLFDYDDLLAEDPRDLRWLIEDIATAKDPSDRRIALRLALEYWSTTDRKWSVLRRIWSAAEQPALRRIVAQSREVRPWWPLVGFWNRNVRYKLLSDAWWHRWGLRLRRFWGALRAKIWLLRRISELYSGRLIYQISELAMEAASDHSRWAATDWRAVTKKRGWLIANAAKHGCSSTWASFAPPLACEAPLSSSTDRRIVIGLCGLEALWQDKKLDFARLSETDAESAARYAFRELNGFPPWFPSLVENRPDVVRRLVFKAVDAVWEIPDKQDQLPDELHRLARKGEYVFPLVEDYLLSRLRESDPANVQVLIQILEILATRTLAARPQLEALARNRLLSSAPDRPRHVVWLSVGLQTNAPSTLSYLEEALPGFQDADSVVLELCLALNDKESWGQRGPLFQQPDYERAEHLGRLIPIIYRHVRFAEDIDRSHGGTYSPTTRDAAQEFRNGLLPRLASQDNPVAQDALETLLNAHELANEREWIRHLMDQHLELLAERPPWKPHSLHEFADEFECTPRTPYELYRLALSRFTDVRHSVEAAEVSARDDLRESDDEAKLRSWLRRQLVQRSKDRYNVPQEEEVDLEKRPDLQLEVPGLPPLPVEIKWADRWTLAELLERLENQLLGDYLRAYGNRFGIFLIADHGEKSYWRDPGSRRRLSFPDLQLILQRKAHTLASERHDVDAVAVVTIDFKRPD